MEMISCDKCGKEFPKTKLKKCQTCGQVLCFKCRLFHKCSPETKDMPSAPSQKIAYNGDTSTASHYPATDMISFRLKQGVYAQKYEFENLSGLSEKGFKIHAGLKAFFIQNEVLRTTLRAGSYPSLSSVNSLSGTKRLSLDEYTTVILVDTTLIPLSFEFSDSEIKTQDDVGVHVTGNLSLSIKDGMLFDTHYFVTDSEVTTEIVSRDVVSLLRDCSAEILTRYDNSEFEKYSYLLSIVKDSVKECLSDSLSSRGLTVITFSSDFNFSLPTIKPHNFESDFSALKSELVSDEPISETNNISVDIREVDRKYANALASEHARKSYFEKERFYFERSFPDGNFQLELEKMVLADPLNLPVHPVLLSLLDSNNKDVRRVVGEELVQRAIIVGPDDISLISREHLFLAGNILVAKSNFETLSQLKEFMETDYQTFESMMREQYGVLSDDMISVLNSFFLELHDSSY